MVSCDTVTFPHRNLDLCANRNDLVAEVDQWLPNETRSMIRTCCLLRQTRKLLTRHQCNYQRSWISRKCKLEQYKESKYIQPWLNRAAPMIRNLQLLAEVRHDVSHETKHLRWGVCDPSDIHFWQSKSNVCSFWRNPVAQCRQHVYLLLYCEWSAIVEIIEA